MKQLFAILLLFLLVSCKNENAVATATGANYPEDPVGTNKNGVYSIDDPKSLAAKWESNLEGASELTGFEIVKALTEEDVPEEVFMVVARTEDGQTKVASLVYLKGNKFYFGSEEKKDAESYVMITCQGECDEGCLPVVKKSNGSHYLVCSPCVGCSKYESGMR